MEIERYFPSAVKDTKEFNLIADAENPLVIDLWNNLSFILEEVFIMTMSIEGILRFEKMLDIVPENDDLEERRSVIIAALLGQAPFTLPFLQEKVRVYFGQESTVSVDYDNYALFIRAVENYNEQKKAFAVFLKKVLPANMIYYLIQYTAVSNNLKIKPNLGGSVFVKLPLGIAGIGGSNTVKITANTGSNRYTVIAQAENI